MLRVLNIIAVTALIATAGWAYQTKYETIRYAEEVRKLESKTEKERDTIAILKAEWQLLNRPARLEQLAVKLDLRPLKPGQIARIQDLPERGKEQDRIGAKLDSLLTGSITPEKPRSTASKTPARAAPLRTTSTRTPAAAPKAPAKTAARTTKAVPAPASRAPMNITPSASTPNRTPSSSAAASARR